MTNRSGRVLRIIAIVFMGLAAAMNILGGIGTVCAAFLTKNYPPMWDFYDYRLLYQGLMITTIIVGIAGVWSMVRLVKGGRNAYRDALIILLVGTALAATQYFASMAIRGRAAPANVKFYTNALTLLIFLLLALPPIRKLVDFAGPMGRGEKAAASGLSAMIAGAVMLTIYAWAGPSHAYQGVNWVDVLKVPLISGGLMLTFGGLSAVLYPIVTGLRRQWILREQERAASG